MKIQLGILDDSWKLKWSSGDALLTSYFRKAPAWNPVWSNHEARRKLGLWEGEVENFFFFGQIILEIFSISFFPRKSLSGRSIVVVIF